MDRLFVATPEDREKIRAAVQDTFPVAREWWATATVGRKGVLFDTELAENEEEADRIVADMNARFTRSRSKARCIKVKVTEQ